MTEQPPKDLALATVEDIVQELRNRGLIFAAIVGNTRNRKLASESRCNVYSDALAEKNLGLRAAAFCQGVLASLEAAGEGGPSSPGKDSLVTDLLSRFRVLYFGLEKLVECCNR
jgi:hypothetical protein